MKFFAALALVPLLPIPSFAQGDEDTQRKVKVALAIAKSKSEAATTATPAPREVAPVLPVVVYVGCEGPECRGAIRMEAKEYPGLAAPAVIVKYPVGDRLVTEKQFRGCPTAAELQKAVNDAAKKADAKPMPKPTGKGVSHSGCVCGDGCKCDAGACPGSCPLAPVTVVAAPVREAIPYHEGHNCPKCGEFANVVTAQGNGVHYHTDSKGHSWYHQDAARRVIAPAYSNPFQSGGGCVNGNCPAPARSGWYPGKLLGR